MKNNLKSFIFYEIFYKIRQLSSETFLVKCYNLIKCLLESELLAKCWRAWKFTATLHPNYSDVVDVATHWVSYSILSSA